MSSFRQSARKTADTIHRWLGFSCGAILLIAGLTGTLLAFYMEIDGAVNPRLRTADPHARPASYEAVYRQLQRLPLTEPGSWKIEIPPDGGPITARFSEHLPDGTSRTRMATLDPVTLQVLRDARWRETFFTWIYDLHMNLLFGPPGKIAMGICALFLIGLIFTGIANWALPKGGLAAKLRFKRDASLPRRTYDLHKIAGLVTAPLFLLCLGTAAMICLPNQVRPILGHFSPLKPSPSPLSASPLDRPRISVDQAIALGPKVFPGATVVWVRVPATSAESYDLQIRQAGDPMTRFPRSHVWIDQRTGAILAKRDPHVDAAGDTLLNWLVPLHDGKAFGLAGRIWVMLLGVMPLALLVTGAMRWWQKRQARARKPVRTTLPAAPSIAYRGGD